MNIPHVDRHPWPWNVLQSELGTFHIHTLPSAVPARSTFASLCHSSHWKFTSRQLLEKQLQRNSHSGWNDTKKVDESVNQCKEGWADGQVSEYRRMDRWTDGDWHMDWKGTDRRTDRQRQTDWLTDWLTDWQRDGQGTDRQIDRQKDRQTDWPNVY